MRRAVAAALLALTVLTGLTACSDDDTESLTACETPMKAVHDVDAMHDTVTDLDPVVAVCGTLAEFTAASDKFSDALDSSDPAGHIANRCGHTAAGAVCDEVVGG